VRGLWSFVWQQRALGQHLNFKHHAPVFNHDEDDDIVPIVRSAPVTFDTPSFRPLVPRPMNFDDKFEKEVKFLRGITQCWSSTSWRLFQARARTHRSARYLKRHENSLWKPLFRIPRFGLEQQAIEKAIVSKLNLLSQDDQRTFLCLHNNTSGAFYPLAGIAKTNALSLETDASEGGLFPEASWINHACLKLPTHMKW
jgi:hypothetical protein